MGLFDRIMSLMKLGKGSSKTERRGEKGFVPSAEADQAIALKVLVCAFDGPGGTGVASRLSDALGALTGTEILYRKDVLSGGSKDSLLDQLSRADEIAADWLSSEKAHVCIWGSVDAEADNVTVRFSTLRSDTDSGFGLGDSLILPFVIDEDMARIIHAGAVCAGALAARRPQATTLLAESVDEIAEYIDALPRGLESHQQASSLICIGNIMLGIYQLQGSPGYLHFAIQALEGAIAKSDKNANPVSFALAQSHMARALQAKAGREEGSHSLVAAEEAYKAAAEALDQKKHASDWALAHVRLGTLIYKRATRDSEPKILKSAAEALDKALKSYNRKTMPGRWSETMNQMGVVLLALGEEASGSKILERSAFAFRKTLEVRKRELAPVLWAQTINNLGAATFALAKRSKDPKHFHEAKSCFEGAMEVYNEANQPKKAKIIEKNLHRVERLLNAAPAEEAEQGEG